MEQTAIARKLLGEEIERIVLEAQARGVVVRTGPHAADLLRQFPQAGYSLGRIIDEIASAAAVLGVPVELSRDPEPREP